MLSCRVVVGLEDAACKKSLQGVGRNTGIAELVCGARGSLAQF
jgi:hypothetical protein